MSVPAARWGIALPPPMRISPHAIDASTRYSRFYHTYCPRFVHCDTANVPWLCSLLG
jgi:hypothetical protein